MADEAIPYTTITLSEYLADLGVGGREYLPSKPLDVDQRLYQKLGEREFDNCNCEEFPLRDFIAGLQEMASEAPDDAEVLIKLRGYSWDGDCSAEYELGYWRDPTPEERAARVETNRKIEERDKRNAEAAAMQERKEYERLKTKFER